MNPLTYAPYGQRISMTKNFAAIDFETANRCRSSVCSVGIVVVRENEIVDEFYRLIQPAPNFYSHWNVRVHGLTEKDTCNAARFPEVWAQIAPRIEDLPLVAHNSSFDEGCLKAVFSHYRMSYPDYRFFCTCRAARRLLPHLPDHKLGTVASFCGFDLVNHHHALADARACARIALKLLDL